MQPNKFIHFGCWNNMNYVDIPPLVKVMSALKNIVNKGKHDFIVIAGDNYYNLKQEHPNKKGKPPKITKTIIIDKMKEGFDLLPTNIPIDMILGNRDLETNTVNRQELVVRGHGKELKNCAIMTAEKEYLKKKKNVDFTLHKSRILGDNTLVLMIDTNMYDDENAERFIPCYNTLHATKQQNEINKFREEQLNFVTREILLHKGVIKNIIIIGHNPITGYEIKNNIITQIKPFPAFIQLLETIHSIAGNVKYYYLCADVHLYQIGTVLINNEFRINQYIVGTGGAKLTENIYQQEPINNNLRITYEMNNVQRDASLRGYGHGFLECSLVGEELLFRFKKIHKNGVVNVLEKKSKTKTKTRIKKGLKTRKNKLLL